MSDKHGMMQKIMSQVEGAPVFIAKAMEWLKNHPRLAQAICEDCIPISEKAFGQEVQRALKTQDHAYYALLVYSKAMQEQHGGEHSDQITACCSAPTVCGDS